MPQDRLGHLGLLLAAERLRTGDRAGRPAAGARKRRRRRPSAPMRRACWPLYRTAGRAVFAASSTGRSSGSTFSGLSSRSGIQSLHLHAASGAKPSPASSAATSRDRRQWSGWERGATVFDVLVRRTCPSTTSGCPISSRAGIRCPICFSCLPTTWDWPCHRAWTANLRWWRKAARWLNWGRGTAAWRWPDIGRLAPIGPAGWRRHRRMTRRGSRRAASPLHAPVEARGRTYRVLPGPGGPESVGAAFARLEAARYPATVGEIDRPGFSGVTIIRIPD